MTEQHVDQPQFSQIDFKTVLKDVKNLPEIEVVINHSMQELQQQGQKRIGFVSGPIANSTNPNPEVKRQAMLENMDLMRKKQMRFA